MRGFTDLADRVRLAALSSERVLATVLRYLAEGGTDPDLRRQVWDSVATPDAHAFRHDDLKSAQAIYLPQETGGIYHLDPLTYLADHLLMFDGDRFVVRPERRLEHLHWIAHVDPAFMVGAALARRLRDGEITVQALESFSRDQCALALPRPPAGKVWADNHVHLGGVSSSAMSLMAMADSRKDFKPDDWRVPQRFQTLFGGYSIPVASWLLHAYRQCVTALLGTYCHPESKIEPLLADALASLLDNGIRLTDLPRVRFDTVKECFAPQVNDLGQQLVCLMADKIVGERPKDAFIILATLISLEDQAPNTRAERRALLLALVHLAHALRQAMVMEGVGLQSFMGYFGSTARKTGNTDADKLAWITGGDHLRSEIKFTAPSSDQDGALHKVISRHLKHIKALPRTSRQQIQATDRFHYCHHFSRSDDGDTSKRATGYGLRYREKRLKAKQQAKAIIRNLSVPHWHDLGDGSRLDLNSLLRGFDVAGNENQHPIEVFAPTLRWMREHPLMVQDPRSLQSAPRRSLSVHAGEDFKHLLSGLRHLDETVKFCAMGNGDRLGHGLALGLSPHDWALRQGTALVRMDHHLDNLVWLWRQALRLSTLMPMKTSILVDLEMRIGFYAKALNEPDAPPDIRYRAWKLRRNCPDTVEKHETNIPPARYWAPDFFHDQTLHDSEIHQLYRWYLQQRLEKAPPMLEVKLSGEGKPTEKHDFFGTAYLDLLEAVQDDRMTEYDRRGVVLEACPSSNLYIARIASLEEHPALRWHPPQDQLLEPGAIFNRFGLRKGRVRVCVNTDDPGVFPTDIVAEHYLLGEAAKQRFGLSQSETEDWQERLRLTGLEVFQHHHALVRIDDSF